jgi:hypothetical protein
MLLDDMFRLEELSLAIAARHVVATSSRDITEIARAPRIRM